MYANRFYIFYLRLIYLEILKVLKVYRNSMPICLALSKQLDQPPPDVQPPIYTKWPLRLFSRSVFVYCILYTVFVFFFLLRELGPWGWAHEFSSHLQPRARTCYDTHTDSQQWTQRICETFSLSSPGNIDLYILRFYIEYANTREWCVKYPRLI